MLLTESYTIQSGQWPKSGKHIMAQVASDNVVVYQAYRPSTGSYAAQHGHFGPGFSYSRMSWIKPSFLWMLSRSGWGTKAGQEITLAIRIRRSFFDALLGQAVASSFSSQQYENRDEWLRAVRASSVRLQWDPDRTPQGGALARRALQLGLRQQSLEDYAEREILEIIDVSAFVAEQRQNAARQRLGELVTPQERVYVPDNRALTARLGLSDVGTAA